MDNIQVCEIREALLAVLSTAASVGIDIDLLCHLAAEELLDDQSLNAVEPHAAGAVYQLAVCMNLILEPVDSGDFKAAD